MVDYRSSTPKKIIILLLLKETFEQQNYWKQRNILYSDKKINLLRRHRNIKYVCCNPKDKAIRCVSI